MAEDAAQRSEAAASGALHRSSAGAEGMGLPPPHPHSDAAYAAFAAAAAATIPEAFQWTGGAGRGVPTSAAALRRGHSSDNGVRCQADAMLCDSVF